jgi:phosphomannomutase/phosphoglucomutase
MVHRHIFREFSIRGIADQDLPDRVVTLIGQAIGSFFRQRQRQTLVVGQDVRNSSLRIGRSLINGLLAAGMDVVDVGIVPTPVHNFATDFYAADGGVMITASHNPPEYNGLKIRADHTLNGEELREIYRIAAGNSADMTISLPDSGAAPKRIDPLPVYAAHLSPHARIRRPLKVVVDAGDGTNGLIVPDLVRDWGCQVFPLHCEPDGDFPHRDPDPTAPGAMSDLAVRVQSEGADLGLAYDGDGDRLALVDEQGHPVPGDQVLMLLARDVLRHGPAKIVYEILCTQALADDVLAHGGEPIMAASGYAFVHQAMHATDAALGGEFSGHLFFDEPGFRFDDSILASLKILNIVSSSQLPLSALVADLPSYHSSPQIRLACPDTVKAQVVEQIKNHYKTAYPVDELDGARVDFGDGWALVRASNTQPALSLRFEARSQDNLERYKTQVLDLVELWTARLSQAAGSRTVQ